MPTAIATTIVGLTLAGSSTPTTVEMSQRYARATASTAAALAPLVLNASVSPHWLDDGGFWYRRALESGGEFRVVHASGAKSIAFDHPRLAASASRAATATIGSLTLNVTGLEPGRSVELTVDGKIVRCTLTDYRCAAPVVPEAKNPRQTLSPDGRKAVFVKDHDLWLRDIGSGRVSPLTTDGEAYFAWGKLPDLSLLTLVNERHALPLPPWGASWSPDGRFLVASRIDERPIKPYPFYEGAPQDGSFRPIARTVRIHLLGEPAPVFSGMVFDTVTGKRVPIALPQDFSKTNMIDIFGWSADGKSFYAVLPGKDRDLDLKEINAETGAIRTLVTESAKGFLGLNSEMYNAPNVRQIKSGREILWYSQRSGWGHLYRYDLRTGKLLNAVTRGEWLVRDILHVDEARRRIVFTASGREGGDPYRRRVYRVNFDGSDLLLLTPEDADHTIAGQATGAFALFFGIPKTASKVSPDGASFIDTWSTPDTPPITVLRRTSDGGVIARLESADISGLTALGWRPPEHLVVKAADGKTDLYGAIWWPDEAMGDRVPVIDNLYGGPQSAIVPHGFTASGWNDSFAMTKLGFAVVTVDGRGTPLRSQAFQDESFVNFGDTMVADHAAVLEQLTARYPRLDKDKVGVTGHSLGGYVSTRAMLQRPDLFKVGVSSAGSQIYEALYGTSGVFQTPDYGDGRELKPRPDASPANYRAMSNAPLAANLRGRLLIGHGELDENALPGTTLQFIDALIKAGRRYDLVYLPNVTHRFGSGGDYFTLRRWDYFTEHLLGVEPPLPPYDSTSPRR
ncbi:S9 family peptidase [Sphingosinicella rhizophila]|uniref:Alpha/beta fold hydrolase n=1 Tax=Sphingosinicella rhizophila TaxID=3050082 RepID=A0ABU3QB21_9SPHN|nr:alpha/beta fold hydrolase [Sphingosinicella sp. GR2756]MDT9600596.1 alpha/beta fold hydrolase [Sphingosinicella sp. GR2756]